MNALARHKHLDAIWGDPPGWRGVLYSVNHTRLGKRFMLAACIFFVIAGLLAMLIRAQLASPRSAFVGPEVFNQLFTMHGSIMMFLFAIPMFEGLAMYLLPKMLGARDLAFPRLSALGWWCYLFGGCILIGALLAGVAPDGGWFMYTPLSGKTYTPGINADVWLLGVTFVEISAVCAAIEIVVTILYCRAPGMALRRMPIFAWYMLGTATMMMLGFPPLILGSILLEVERAFGWAFFDPLRGGDPLLWQHLFWLFGHPEVYIIFLPAAGVVSTLLPVLARTRLIGYGMVVAAIAATVVLSMGLWVHHMFTVGIPHMALAFFSIASALVALPTSVQIFAWLGTLWRGRPRMSLPMLYLFGFFVTFVMGGLTGVMLAVVPFDWQAHDTAFVTAHLHYVLIGGYVFPMMAALHYWLPHITRRGTSDTLGKAAFWLVFVGFHATFLIMHLTGLLGMPRRVDTYAEGYGWTVPNLVSSVGGFVMAFGFALFVVDICLRLRAGSRAPRNPFGGTTLEWAMPLPPPTYNFAALPAVSSRDPMADDPDLARTLAIGQGHLAEARNGWRETLVVDPARGEPRHVAILPGPGVLPIAVALVCAAFFLLMLAGAYRWAPLTLPPLAWLAWRWAWQGGSDRPVPPLDAGQGLQLPVHWHSPHTLANAGQIALLVMDAVLLASLLFGVAYLWTIAPQWPTPVPWRSGGTWCWLALAGTGLLFLASRDRAPPPLARWLPAALAGLLAATGALLWAMRDMPDPATHAHHAVHMMLLCYALVHVVVGAIILAYAWRRYVAGFLAADRPDAWPACRRWLRFTSIALLLVVIANLLPEWLA
ncbi:MAG: cytochrome c oxidase subunit I [Pseudoxanthomonas suwonensis]|nr:cytochrome c oxidase subunit I [Pseudoxanthomonas suwonensis]